MIEVEGLTQRYGGYTAVRDLTFRVETGEVVGFLGPNGAGKTTTLRVIAAYLAPSEGRVVVAGHDVRSAPLEARRALGYLPEQCPLYEEMLAARLLEFVADVRGVPRSAITRAAERCGVADVLGRPIAELSKGYRQRVGLAAAILHEPKVLVLDEPTSGLDPNQVLEVRELVRELGRERTVLFSSHVLSEVEATCARVLVVSRGRLVADEPVAGLKRRLGGGAVRVRVEAPPADVAGRLGRVEGVEAVARAGDRWDVTPREGVTDLPARLFRFAVEQGLVLTELASREGTLEEAFASLTAAGELSAFSDQASANTRGSDPLAG